MNYQSYSSLILCSFLLSGCGQQGPLYMPIEEPPIVSQPVEILPADTAIENLNSEAQDVIENTESLAPVDLEKPPVLVTPESIEREESLERLDSFNNDVPPVEAL